MADNLHSGELVVDITQDTVSEQSLLRGYTAHDSQGRAIVGEAEQAPMVLGTVRLKVREADDIRLGIKDSELVSFGTNEYIPVRPADVDIYDGEYIVIPGTAEVTLPTAEKMLEQDIVVEEIPTYEVDNPSGGRTFIIAS